MKVHSVLSQDNFSYVIIEKISNSQHGILADHCFNALNSGFSAIAIKAYSMEILYKLALIYPELANELSASINMLQGEGSAGIIARGRMILKKLAEITYKTQDPVSNNLKSFRRKSLFNLPIFCRQVLYCNAGKDDLIREA